MLGHGDFPVVALVGSTGGLRAVESVLGGIPGDFGAAVIVLIHHSPDQAPAMLPDLLRRASHLPVAAAVEGAPLRPGQLVTVPPGKHLLLDAELHLRLIDAGRPPPSRPSADLLLATLAMTIGPRAIAVVLSGQGHDGATGATAINHAGGTVVVTSEISSEAFSMPNATILRDHIDPSVVDLEDLAGHLTTLVAGKTPGPSAPGDGTDR